MKSTAKYEETSRRLAELERESSDLINSYLSQVATNADSPGIKKLQERLDAIRREQMHLYEVLVKN
ncbi:MAG TPA: hypothetical protein VG603_05335 [Chitinophagales bacterium]|nr:hypothetical protein [Chitinophagales bacterium]